MYYVVRTTYKELNCVKCLNVQGFYLKTNILSYLFRKKIKIFIMSTVI